MGISAAFAMGGQRIGAGWERVFARPIVASPAALAPLERPSVILAIFVVLSVLFMIGADYPIGVWMQDFPEELRGIALGITKLGEGVEVLVVSGALLVAGAFVPVSRLRRRLVVAVNAVTSAAAFVFLSVAGGGLVSLLLKYTIGRARPSLLDTHSYLHFQPLAFHSDFSAFPSGHSATAGAMAMSLALVFPRWRSVFIPLGILICLSRQLVGMHWTSDTLMGWAVGVAFTMWLAHIFARRRLMFSYDAEGCLRRVAGRRLFRRLWQGRKGGAQNE